MGRNKKNTCRVLVLKLAEKKAIRTRSFKWEYDTKIMGTDSSVSTVNRYRLDGREIESGWGEIFSTRPDRPWGLPSFLYSYNGYRISFPPPSSAEVKERVELHLYSAFGPSWSVLR